MTTVNWITLGLSLVSIAVTLGFTIATYHRNKKTHRLLERQNNE